MINLQIEGLTKSFGDRVLFADIAFGLSEGERVGLIAKNGTGKTTLLNIIAGDESYDSGTITFRNGIRVGYLRQLPVFPAEITVLQACFATDSEITRTIREYESAMAHNDTARLETLVNRMEQLKAWDYEQRVKQILSQLKINDFDQPMGQLSGGQQKRVALANVLIAEPDLLILDEPTNHLDLEMTEWLEDFLSHSRVCLLMVTHDRYFLDRVCNRIVEIDSRALYTYKGNYSYYLEKRQERIEARNAEIDRANNLLRTELDWMRRQPQARGTKAKYRIDAFYELEKKARAEKVEENVTLAVKSSYIGSKIFEIKHLHKQFGEKKIIEDFSYTFSRYEKVGIVGSNGTGKSTFIKMLIGLLPPDGGTIDIGETVRFGYYSQEGIQFDNQKKVIDAVRDIAEEISLGDGKKLSASQFLQHFLFTPETQYNYIYKLSGGEKRRLYLCTVLMSNPNFLVLDEPTNDLDIVTLNLLEDYLRHFKGCVIVVSHDRYFVDKVVDHIWAFEGEGRIKDFPGNYSDYRLWKVAREAEEKRTMSSAGVREKRREKPEKADAEMVKQRRKLTFKEKKEFEELDALIPRLEADKAALEADLSSGALSANELQEKSLALGRLMEEIDEKSMRWLELSEWL